MTAPILSTDRGACLRKQELIEAIRAAMDQVIALTRQEFRAVKRHDAQETQRIQRELKNTMAFKASLLEKYNAHVRDHGCK